MAGGQPIRIKAPGRSAITPTFPIGTDWFTGPHRATYLTALYAETDQHSSYSRLATDPGGENTIIMFKSCFPNSNLDGNPDDPPAASADMNSPYDVAHAKRIYLDALTYFAAHQDKFFVVITAPPLAASATDASASGQRPRLQQLADERLAQRLCLPQRGRV